MFRNKNESHEICLKDCNDTWITDCKQVSNVSNKNFPNVVHELEQQIPTTNESPLDYMPEGVITSVFVGTAQFRRLGN